jgi:hypothetical protein
MIYLRQLTEAHPDRLYMMYSQGATSAHTNPKKVFVAVSERLLPSLLRTAFTPGQLAATPVGTGGSKSAVHDPSADACRLLQQTLFSSSHLAGLASAAAAATAVSRHQSTSRELIENDTKPIERAAKAAKTTDNKTPIGPAGSKPRYQRLLFESLTAEVRQAKDAGKEDCAAAMQLLSTALPWMLKSFCAGLRAHHRRQTGGGGALMHLKIHIQRLLGYR